MIPSLRSDCRHHGVVEDHVEGSQARVVIRNDGEQTEARTQSNSDASTFMRRCIASPVQLNPPCCFTLHVVISHETNLIPKHTPPAKTKCDGKKTIPLALAPTLKQQGGSPTLIPPVQKCEGANSP